MTPSSTPTPTRDRDVLDLVHHHRVVAALDAQLVGVDLLAPDTWSAQDHDRHDQRGAAVVLMQKQLRLLLEHDRLDVGLHQAVRDGWLTAQEGQDLWRWGVSYLQDHQRPQDGAQVHLVVMALLGERRQIQATAAEVTRLAQADLDAWAVAHRVTLTAQAFPEPIHPLLWATLSTGQQHRLVQDLADGRESVDMQRLLHAQAQRTQWDDPRESHVEPLVVPLVLVSRPLDTHDPQAARPGDLTLDLLDLDEEDQVWTQLKTVNPKGVEVLPPLPLTIGLTEALLDFMCMSRDLLAVLHGVPSEHWGDVQPQAPRERPDGLGVPLHLNGEPVGELVLHAGWFSLTETDAMERVWAALDGTSPETFPGLADSSEEPAAPVRRPPRLH